MIEFGITVVLVIAILIFLKERKKCSSCCPSKETLNSEPKIPEQVKQQPETKPAEKPIVNAEPTPVNPQITDATTVTPPEPKPVDIEPSVKPQVSAKPQAEAAVSPAENTGSLLPQDSILKRHYLTHVCTMIESLAPPRPTDSVLCRHYDAMLVTEIDQCLNNKKAMDQLVHAYENKN